MGNSSEGYHKIADPKDINFDKLVENFLEESYIINDLMDELILNIDSEYKIFINYNCYDNITVYINLAASIIATIQHLKTKYHTIDHKHYDDKSKEIRTKIKSIQQ